MPFSNKKEADFAEENQSFQTVRFRTLHVNEHKERQFTDKR